jgi:hypothetical protein
MGEWFRLAANEAEGIDCQQILSSIPVPEHQKEKLPFNWVLRIIEAYKAGTVCLECFSKGWFIFYNEEGRPNVATAVYDPETNKNYCELCGLEIIRE